MNTVSKPDRLTRQTAMQCFGMTASLVFFAGPAFTACLSPFQTVLACELRGRPQTVEVCAIHDNYSASQMTYAFGTPGKEPELSFVPVNTLGSTKYSFLEGSEQSDYIDFGIGLLIETGYVYGIYAKGSYEDGSIIGGILEVSTSADEFGQEVPVIFRAECKPGTIAGDFRFFIP